MSGLSVTVLDRDGAAIRLTNAAAMGGGVHGDRDPDGGVYLVMPATYGSVWPADETPLWVSAPRTEATLAALGVRYALPAWAVATALGVNGEWRDSQSITSLGYSVDEAHGILAIMRAQHEAGL